MKKIALWKSCLLFILCLTMALSTDSLVFGEESPNTGECGLEARVENVADNDQEIRVFIRLTKNSGLDTLELNLNYDASAFTLTKVENLGLLEGADFFESQTYESNPYYLGWIIMDRANPTSKAVGDLAVLTFSVKNAAEKDLYRFSLDGIKGERFSEPDPVTGQVGTPQKVECVAVKDAVYSSDPLVLSMEAKPAVESGYIDVTVSADSNSGVDAVSFCVDYDSERLSLVSAEDMRLLGDPLDINQDFSQERYHCGWIYNPENKEVPYSRDELPKPTGILMKLKFKVNSGAVSGGYHFSISDPDAGYTLQDSVGTLTEHEVAVLAGECTYTISGVTVEGTVISWDNADNAKYLLYDSTMSDADIKADLKLDTPEKALSYTATKGGVTKNADGKRYNQTFSFSQIPEGSYKLVIWKPSHGTRFEEIIVEKEGITGKCMELYMLGDVNLSGSINSTDALWVRQYITKTRIFDDYQKLLGDVNRNGSINSTDALWIRQRILKLRDENYNMI